MSESPLLVSSRESGLPSIICRSINPRMATVQQRADLFLYRREGKDLLVPVVKGYAALNVIVTQRHKSGKKQGLSGYYSRTLKRLYLLESSSHQHGT